MHVLVTGGAGFIGSHSVEALLGAGFKVRVLDDFSTGQRENLAAVADRVEIIEADVRDEVDVTLAMQGIDAVLHLAAVVSVPVSVENMGFAHAVNATGALNVMEVARRSGVRRVVYASSAAVYGTEAPVPATERTPLLPSSPYGSQKRYNEETARLEYELHGLETIGLRYFNIYGPRQDPASPYSGVLSIFIDRLTRRAPVQIHGDGLQSRDFVFVRDVARANLRALSATAGFGGAFNVGTGRQTTVLQAYHAIARELGVLSDPDHGPARPGDIRHSLADAALIRERLGWHHEVAFEEGIAHTIAWFKSTLALP